jgi:hypothetical protein
MSTQTIKLELCGDEGIVINDKSEKEAIKKFELLRKYNEKVLEMKCNGSEGSGKL